MPALRTLLLNKITKVATEYNKFTNPTQIGMKECGMSGARMGSSEG